MSLLFIQGLNINNLYGCWWNTFCLHYRQPLGHTWATSTMLYRHHSFFIRLFIYYRWWGLSGALLLKSSVKEQVFLFSMKLALWLCLTFYLFCVAIMKVRTKLEVLDHKDTWLTLVTLGCVGNVKKKMLLTTATIKARHQVASKLKVKAT